MQSHHYFQTKNSDTYFSSLQQIWPQESPKPSISISLGTFPKDAPSYHIPVIGPQSMGAQPQE